MKYLAILFKNLIEHLIDYILRWFFIEQPFDNCIDKDLFFLTEIFLTLYD